MTNELPPRKFGENINISNLDLRTVMLDKVMVRPDNYETEPGPYLHVSDGKYRRMHGVL
jgi:hypothetical protein